MDPLPLFTRDELAAAFRLVLPPDVADRCAREWFDQCASESVDQRGYFLYKEWWDQSGAPAAPARGLVVQTASVTDAERDAHERKFFGSMTLADRIDLLMRFSDFHLNLVALVSDDVKRRVQAAIRASDGQMERRVTQMRRIVRAFSAPSTEGAA
jgi:hypothetical protein